MKEQDYAKKSFDNVANNYDEIPFFKISARYVVELIQREKDGGALDVLDVACGTGNVVLECASCMPTASFDAMDISEGMLAKAKANARTQKINNISFQLEDITTLNVDKKYDVITCAYALFFLPDAPSLLHTLTTLLKPEGLVIFTSFTAKAFSPSNEILLPLLREYGSATAIAYEMDKWDLIVKTGDEEALALLGYGKNPAITVGDVVLTSDSINVGEALEFEVKLEASEDVKLMVDYLIHFRTKAGTLSPKVHKLKKLELQKGESIVLKKKHPFRANMTTRTLYAGEHVLELQINGTIVKSKIFNLKV